MLARLLPPSTSQPSSVLNLSRSRLLLLIMGALAALITLSACGEVDNTTEFSADGSGVQTLTVRISETDLEDVDGGAGTIESVIAERNPGLNYEGMSKDGTDTLFTLTLAFENAEDYAAKAQPVLEAGELSRTAEVTFTPPTPPFSSGYSMTRNFTAQDLTRWAVLALVQDDRIEGADESSVDDALDQGEVTVEVDGEPLEQSQFASEDQAAEWSNAEAVGFDSIEVSTSGAEDPGADSYTRTITYELARATYLDAQAEFDAFFEAATPEGGELTPAGDAGTTWVLTFPAGTAEQVGTWTDTAIATSDSTFTVETAPSADDPFSIETRVVDSIACTVACATEGPQMGTVLSQQLVLPAGSTTDTAMEAGTEASTDAEATDGTEVVALEGGPEPQVLTRSILFTDASYDLTVNREGGGTLTMALSLPAADDAVVTQENVLALLGDGAERSEADGVVTYTRTAEAETAEDFTGALQQLGLEGMEEGPMVSVADQGDGKYSVTLMFGAGEALFTKLGTQGTWTIQGDGLRPTAIHEDVSEVAQLGEDAITMESGHWVYLSFGAERTGLGAGAIVGIIVGSAFLALLVTAGILAFLHRERIRRLFAGASDGTGGSSGVGPQEPGL